MAERKFFGPESSLCRVLDIVSLKAEPDGKYSHGFINSIYFDTPSLASLAEKTNGDNLKMKLRARWYGESLEDRSEVPVFLEIKYRMGSARDKLRKEIKLPSSVLGEGALDQSGELCRIVHREIASLEAPLSVSWRPVCQISYNRRRFFDVPSQSRLSVDWGIRSERFNKELFPWANPVFLGSMVFEYKNNLGLTPPWAMDMAGAGLKAGSFSKYGTVMERLLDGV